MIDPGHPFSVPYQDLIARLEQSIREGVEQPDQARFTFQSGVTAYELPRPAWDIIRVSGRVGPEFTVFKRDTDYQFDADKNRIAWRTEPPKDAPPPKHPDNGSRFDVEYTYRDRPAGLTDFNPGSVIGTLIRTVAREMKLLYEQMDQAYRRAFIDQASGVALDNVVALLGVTRNPPTKAKGDVTFSRKTATNEYITIPMNTRVADASGRTFVTPDTEFTIKANDKSVTVPIEATEPGPEGNVNAGAIVLMPTPPSGVDSVINEAPVDGGQEAESDDQLRERAKHALERSGNATLNAIKFAVLDVDGVEGVEVVDHSTDETIPLGEVRVRFSGGDADEVARVIEQTRAAGIMVRPEEIHKVMISGTFYVIPDLSVPDTARGTFLSAVIEGMEALTIGQPLSLRRLNALAYQVAGLADVAEAQLLYQKDDPDQAGDVTTAYLAKRTERIRPDEANLKVVLLASLKATASRRVGETNEVDLQVVDTAGAAIEFKNLSIDISVTLRAYSLQTLEQPPERIGNFTRPIVFTNASIATLIIESKDTTGFRSNAHRPDVEVSLTAAAYPGLQGTTKTIDLSH
ncbi:baseplate J/gp47 family protein [Candidatus Poribacteria bacterium]|nr:baseplate J/gp47 family protein [Candidatus Poribacteria bacterium]